MYTRSAELYDAIYSWKDYGGEVVRLEGLLEARRRSRGRSLLDVACGTGKHLELLRERWEVEGLDLDPRMVELARKRLPGVRLQVGDMASFDMGRRYDVVACLFSSIGYMLGSVRLRQAIACMARHLLPGGVLAVEPWFSAEQIELGHVGAHLAEGEDFKVARLSLVRLESDVSVADFHYLLGRAGGVEHFTEQHRLGLHSQAQYADAFRSAGLEPELDERGLMGRGLYLAVNPDRPDTAAGPTE